MSVIFTICSINPWTVHGGINQSILLSEFSCLAEYNEIAYESYLGLISLDQRAIRAKIRKQSRVIGCYAWKISL